MSSVDGADRAHVALVLQALFITAGSRSAPKFNDIDVIVMALLARVSRRLGRVALDTLLFRQRLEIADESVRFSAALRYGSSCRVIDGMTVRAIGQLGQ